jgi:hypothetical protein
MSALINREVARIKHLTVSTTATQSPAIFDSVSVFAGKAIFHNGSSTTATVLTVKGTTAQSGSVVFPQGVRFDQGWAVTITTTGAASVDIALR